ncbi:MAG: peptidoglycan DD-metalloendopeptidase family protein [Synergistaceae bacterium]|nr:peptidoglycan DD-metalloendopeptidase family protein [Synergistaceae bacterium]
MIKRLFAGFILILMLAPGLVSAASKQGLDAQIAAEEKKRSDLTRQIADYKKQIREMGVKVEGLLTKVNTLQQDENFARQELTVLELQNQKIQDNIETLNTNMQEEQIKINELSEQIKGRLVDMYKYREAEAMRTLFASRSVFEAVETAHLLRLVNQRDEAILSQLQARVQNMELSRITMDDQQARLREKTEQVQTQRDRYKKSIKDTNSFINSLRRQKALAEKAALEAEQAQKAAGDMIVMLRKKKDALKKNDYLAGKGRGSMFDWPVRGKISSNYGYRIHPILKRKILHTGIDIAAPNGTPVKAAAAGEVLFDGWLRGYGRVVILDHGRDYSTLYAHLSSSLVKEGQVVRAGATIARVGKTGNVTGYHLHFEVRKGSYVQNPLDYLKK